MQKLSARLREHDTAAASVEHDEVLHEDGLALRLAGHGLPGLDDAALDVFRDGDAGCSSATLLSHQ